MRIVWVHRILPRKVGSSLRRSTKPCSGKSRATDQRKTVPPVPGAHYRFRFPNLFRCRTAQWLCTLCQGRWGRLSSLSLRGAGGSPAGPTRRRAACTTAVVAGRKACPTPLCCPSAHGNSAVGTGDELLRQRDRPLDLRQERAKSRLEVVNIFRIGPGELPQAASEFSSAAGSSPPLASGGRVFSIGWSRR